MVVVSPPGSRTEMRYNDTGYTQVNQRGQLIETLFTDDTPAYLSNNDSMRTEYTQDGKSKPASTSGATALSIAFL